MRKVLLSSAIAAAMGVSGFAQAEVDFRLPASDRTFATYASELTIPASGLEISGAQLNVETALGFGVAVDQRRFVRLDLPNSGVTFSQVPTVEVQDVVPATATVTLADGTTNAVVPLFTDSALTDRAFATVDTVISTTPSQGGAGENFYIVEFTAADTTTATSTLEAGSYYYEDSDGSVVTVSETANDATDGSTGLSQNALVTINGTALDISAAGSVGLTYSLYETAVDASAANTDNRLASSAGVIAGFQNALSVTAELPAPINKIDVTEESVLFDTTPTDQAGIGSVELAVLDATPDDAVDTTPVLLADGTPIINLSQLIDPTDASVELSGDFSSAESLIVNGSTVAIANALNTDGNAEFAVDAADIAGTTAPYAFTYVTDTETVIPETTFNLTVNSDSVAGITLADTYGPFQLVQFEKNGASTQETMTLDPNGAFKNFVRVSNTSGVEGRVFFTIINDAGESESFALSDVSVNGQAQPSTLVAQASTRLIPMSAFVAAAQAKNPDFGIVNAQRNKFRLVIDGEFPTISSNNVTLATDNTTFSTF